MAGGPYKTWSGAAFATMPQGSKDEWRSNLSGRPGKESEPKEGSVGQSNRPTQAKGRLEWATRQICQLNKFLAGWGLTVP